MVHIGFVMHAFLVKHFGFVLVVLVLTAAAMMIKTVEESFDDKDNVAVDGMMMGYKERQNMTKTQHRIEFIHGP